MKKFSYLKFISKLVAFSPRQGINARKTAKFIKKFLKNQNFSYICQEFTTTIPSIRKARLIVDNKAIRCQGCSFVSGKINDNNNLVSSLLDLPNTFKEPNINFNPKNKAISLSYFYWGPALAISRDDVVKVIKAKNIQGYVQVKPQKEKSENILVGNIKNPRYIVFAHYDSLGAGATDNASGVAAAIAVLVNNPKTILETLYVFSGNEELSYEKPVYWGRDFRVFEAKYKSLLERAEKIIIVDSVGNDKTKISQNPYEIHLAFPVLNAKKWQKKIYLLEGDLEKLFAVYHSRADTVRELSEKNLQQASFMLQKLLSA